MESLVSLSCPKCNGRMEIQEGTRVVICPSCQTRSILRGDHGEFRYQVPLRCPRDLAIRTVHGFLSDVSGAFGIGRFAPITDVVLYYVPYRNLAATVMAWAFGLRYVYNKRFEVVGENPDEVYLVERMTWNLAACDATEFGLHEIGLGARPVEAFDLEVARESGMVFEPASTEAEARRSAAESFEARVRKVSKLDRFTMVSTRLIRERVSLVYYPLWMVRLASRSRGYQVVVDGFSGKVRYAKVPGNPGPYRAAVFVFGMALTTLLLVAAGIRLRPLYGLNGGAGLLGMVIPLLAAGMIAALYVEYRTGGEIEYGATGQARKPSFWPSLSLKNLIPRGKRWWEEKEV